MTAAAAYEAETAARLHREAAEIVARYPQARSALLPMLHLVQAEDGYVSPRGIALCAEILDLTTAEVSAVATFYSQYKRHPNGTYTVGVCTNTLCAVMGGDEIFARLAEHLGIGHDETTDDGAITLEWLECNAACDYAPVMMVNWEFFDNMTPAGAIDVVERLRAGDEVAPTRGAAKVCTFKEVSRVLAGFPDGRADEGVGAGQATLEGLRLAREKGWAAPPFPKPPRARTPRTRTAAPAAATPPAQEKAAAPAAPPGEAGEKPRRAPRATRPRAGAPQPGEPQSSAERQPTTPADTDRRTTTRKRPPTAGEKD
jgi:NADH-quinone oxidoreductase subunit E